MKVPANRQRSTLNAADVRRLHRTPCLSCMAGTAKLPRPSVANICSLPFTRSDMSPEEAEILRRSIAMLPPQSPSGLSRGTRSHDPRSARAGTERTAKTMSSASLRSPTRQHPRRGVQGMLTLRGTTNCGSRCPSTRSQDVRGVSGRLVPKDTFWVAQHDSPDRNVARGLSALPFQPFQAKKLRIRGAWSASDLAPSRPREDSNLPPSAYKGESCHRIRWSRVAKLSHIGWSQTMIPRAGETLSDVVKPGETEMLGLLLGRAKPGKRPRRGGRPTRPRLSGARQGSPRRRHCSACLLAEVRRERS